MNEYYGPMEAKQHTFKEEVRRPSEVRARVVMLLSLKEISPLQIITNIFTYLCLTPAAFALIAWIRIGALNFGRMPISLYTLGFHAGFGGMCAFFSYVAFICRFYSDSRPIRHLLVPPRYVHHAEDSRRRRLVHDPLRQSHAVVDERTTPFDQVRAGSGLFSLDFAFPTERTRKMTSSRQRARRDSRSHVGQTTPSCPYLLPVR